MQWRQFILVPIVAIILVTFFLLRPDSDAPEEDVPDPVSKQEVIPDFASYRDVRKKKSDFFNFLLPMIRAANEAVVKERELLAPLVALVGAGKPLNSKQSATVARLAKKYRARLDGKPTPAVMNDLLRRVDIVPASLVLAQAANESAWGTSRFARQGNNFFGIWCFSPGCGFTPRSRDEGLVHEVMRFDSVQHGVNYYLRTINSNPAYAELRRIRERTRERGEPITGSRLAEGLVRYSERGEKYVAEIKSMISYNKLQEFTVQPDISGGL